MSTKLATLPLTITRTEAVVLVKLLGELQTYLEGGIESATFDGDINTAEPWLRPQLKRDRKLWRIADHLAGKLGGQS